MIRTDINQNTTKTRPLPPLLVAKVAMWPVISQKQDLANTLKYELMENEETYAHRIHGTGIFT